jgi:hypothetical protein
MSYDLLVTPRNVNPKYEHAGGQRLAGKADHSGVMARWLKAKC